VQNPPRVALELASLDDQWLTVALETDPAVMAELGGPWTEQEARATHRRRTANITPDHWWFTVRPMADDGSIGDPIGTIGVWASEWQGEPCSETGWMILPRHQGKGYASAALRAILDRAIAERRWGDIHAFPGATNLASNALCRKFGFDLVGIGDADYADRHFPVNHWIWRAPGSG
jgi:RimJ/RimL family protein N-acetyltransferase